MVLEITRNRYAFRTKEIWFADRPYDIQGLDMVLFQCCKDKVDLPGFIRKESVTFVIDLTQDLDTIWNNISSGNGRKAIRRAKRANVKIKINQEYEKFYDLYKSVRENKRLPGAIRLGDIKKYGTLFTAEYDGKIISGHAYLEDAHNIRSWVTGSARFEKDAHEIALVANAGKSIVWEAIQYAKKKGIRTFDFGGYYAGGMNGERTNMPNWFKQSFGGKVTTTYIYKKDYSKIYIGARNVRAFLERIYSGLLHIWIKMRRTLRI